MTAKREKIKKKKHSYVWLSVLSVVLFFFIWWLFTEGSLGTIKENVLTGMRVGLGVAWSTIIGAEMLAATAGLGYLINLCRGIYRPDIIIASMICVGVIGAALGLVLTFVEKQLMKGGRW